MTRPTCAAARRDDFCRASELFLRCRTSEELSSISPLEDEQYDRVKSSRLVVKARVEAPIGTPIRNTEKKNSIKRQRLRAPLFMARRKSAFEANSSERIQIVSRPENTRLSSSSLIWTKTFGSFSLSHCCPWTKALPFVDLFKWRDTMQDGIIDDR